MDFELKEQWMKIMLALKHLRFPLPAEIPLQIREFFFLASLSEKPPPDEADPIQRIRNRGNTTHTHKDLQISKPAVSQMLNSLQKKGYITRSIDALDRRKIEVNITDLGKEVLNDVKNFSDSELNRVFESFGHENIKQFLTLAQTLLEIWEPNMFDGKENNN